jgi:hypothetical protein
LDGAVLSAVLENIRNWGSEFDRGAQALQIEAAALHAIAAAEIGAMRPPPSGLPVIRFEVHSCLRKTKADLSAVIQLRDAPTAWHADAHWYRSDPADAWERVHSGSQADEWGALAAAATIDPETALASASYGVGQLMGWHWQTIGCEDVRHMVAEAMRGAPMQFNQWMRFLEWEQDGKLLNAMRAQDWKAFAAAYNGSGQVVYYSDAIAKHYASAEHAFNSNPTQRADILLDTWRQRQMALNQLGYSCGVDGSFGPQTRQAVKSFQAANGLTPDGLWGAKTERVVEEKLQAG